MDRPIFLIGFMCSGKSTLGEALARASDIEFVDLDEYVEKKAGLSIEAIFREQGEARFRELERKSLIEASRLKNAVIALGGGTPCQDGAMAFLNEIGITVYLRPSRHRLITRLLEGRAKRPLISNICSADEMNSFADAKLAEREHYYKQAKFTFDSTYLENAEEIASSVERFNNEIMTI